MQKNLNASWSGQSPFKTGLKAGRFYSINNKEQERENKPFLIGWGCMDLVWGEKAQSWPGIWGVTDWIFCSSGQVGHSWECRSYLSYADGLHPRPNSRSGSNLGLKSYFNKCLCKKEIIEKLFGRIPGWFESPQYLQYLLHTFRDAEKESK